MAHQQDQSLPTFPVQTQRHVLDVSLRSHGAALQDEPQIRRVDAEAYNTAALVNRCLSGLSIRFKHVGDSTNRLLFESLSEGRPGAGPES